MIPVLDRNAGVMNLTGEDLVLEVLRDDGVKSLVVGAVVEKTCGQNEDNENEEVEQGWFGVGYLLFCQ